MTDATAPLLVTEHELVQLLLMTPNDSTQAVAELLAMDALVADPKLARAGVQTLLARGFATLNGDVITAVGPAQVLGAITARSTDWLVVTVDGVDVHAQLAIIGSPVGGLLLVLQPTGVHEARPFGPDVPVLDMATMLVQAYGLDQAITKPCQVRVRRHFLDRPEVGVSFVVEADGTWTFRRSLLQTTHGSPDEVWSAVASAIS